MFETVLNDNIDIRGAGAIVRSASLCGPTRALLNSVLKIHFMSLGQDMNALVEVFHTFPQSLRESALIIPQNYAMTVSFHLLCKPLFTNFQSSDKIYVLNLGPASCCCHINLLKPIGHVMHHRFNIQQLYALSTLY